MKRILLGLTATLVFALGSMVAPLVPPADAGDPSPILTRIMERKELIVGMTGDQPPLNMKNNEGKIIGLDADLARVLAGSMEVKLKIVTKPFADLLPAVARGDIDMAISGITMTLQRNMEVAFAGPYFVSGKSILTKSMTLAKLESVDQMNDPKFTFTALSGSTSEIFVKELLSKATLTTTTDYAAATTLLRSGEADALVADLPYCVFASLRDPDKELDSMTAPLTFEPLGIALPPNDPLLMNLVQNLLTTLEGTGTLDKLSHRWFKDSSWLDEVP